MQRETPGEYFRAMKIWGNRKFTYDDIMRDRGIKPLNLDDLQARREEKRAKRKALINLMMITGIALCFSYLILNVVYRKMKNDIPYNDTFGGIACWGLGGTLNDLETQ